jgi:hypothetical protein
VKPDRQAGREIYGDAVKKKRDMEAAILFALLGSKN